MRAITRQSSSAYRVGSLPCPTLKTSRMRALHLPGVSAGEVSPFSFPSNPPPASALEYPPSGFPVPRPDDEHCYLVRVLATSLIRGELTGAEVLTPSRFKPCRGAVPCHDFVGIMDKILPSEHASRLFREGDRVWGLIDFDRDGAATEYVTATENELCLAPKFPDDIDEANWTEKLATLPISTLTAWQALFILGGCPEQLQDPHHSDQVLVLGSGVVAMAVIELARNAGHDVTVVASKKGTVVLADSTRSILSPRKIIKDGEDLIRRLTLPATPDGSVVKLAKQNIIVDTMGGQVVSNC